MDTITFESDEFGYGAIGDGAGNADEPVELDEQSALSELNAADDAAAGRSAPVGVRCMPAPSCDGGGGGKRRRTGDDPMDWHLRVESPLAAEAKRRRRAALADERRLDQMLAGIEARRRAAGGGDNGQNGGGADGAGAQPSDVHGARESSLHSLPPVESGRPWMPVAGAEPHSDTFYLTGGRSFIPGAADEADAELTTERPCAPGSLCGRSFAELLAEAVDINLRLERGGEEDGADENERGSDHPTAHGHGSLWVEKYRPRNFIDLLSDDGVNRCLMSWLKLWDCRVFGRRPAREDDEKAAAKAAKSARRHYQQEVQLRLDANNMPEYKIVLLCGAPGLGKTTLAHVAGTHAAYNVVEVNASDDRTLDKFRGRVDSAMAASRTVDGRRPRPNLLVLDEVDGAPAPSINYLVSLAKDGAAKGKKRRAPLSRPVVCICNDAYAPSLRELRKIALVVTVPATSHARLVQRLDHVCAAERVHCDSSVLRALAAKTECDIRSCINFIQFAAAHGHTAAIDMQQVNSAALGVKDRHESLFDVCRTVLTAVPAANATKPSQGRKAQSRFDSIYCSAVSFGDYDKLGNMLFENYPHVKQKQSSVHKTAYGVDWLLFGERLSHCIGSRQQYDMMKYMPYVSVAVNQSLAGAHAAVPNRLLYPHSGAQARDKQRRSAEALSSLLEGTAACRAAYDTAVCATELLPHLMHILAPNIRPMNAQLYSSDEKASVVRVVDAMLHFGMCYVQRTVHGQHADNTAVAQYEYVLEPPVEELSLFDQDASGKCQRVPMTYSAKQMVAREVQLERVRCDAAKANSAPADGAAAATMRGRAASAAASNAAQSAKGASGKDTQSQRPVAATHALGTLPFQPIGGRRADSGGAHASGASRPLHSAVPVCYKFTAGYTNAVRRYIRMEHLL